MDEIAVVGRQTPQEPLGEGRRAGQLPGLRDVEPPTLSSRDPRGALGK
ncbi:hypothetical protein [Saccharomonospora marina]|nr:hypothetical protein [Saccharomonospora marina]